MQLRDRYYNALSMSHSKGPWTREEDAILKQGYNLYGAQWTLVSEHVKSRTDGQCLKRHQLLEEYKVAKKPVKYTTLTNTKLQRNLKLGCPYQKLTKKSYFSRVKSNKNPLDTLFEAEKDDFGGY